MAADGGQFDVIDIHEVPGGFPDLPDLAGLLALWRDKASAGDLPSRSAFKTAEMRAWLGHVSLLDVVDDPRRFRWRLIGSRIVERMGRDRTGQWLDEIYSGPALSEFIRLYETVVAKRAPFCFAGTLRFVGKQHVAFQAVVMPLAEKGEDVNMLMLGMHFDI